MRCAQSVVPPVAVKGKPAETVFYFMLLQIQGKQMAAPLSALPFSCDSDCGHDVVALYGSKKRLLLLTCEKCKTTETVLSRADDGEVCSVASAKMSVSVNLSVHASPSVALCVCVCVF